MSGPDPAHVAPVASRGRELGPTELVADALADNLAVPLVLLSVLREVTLGRGRPRDHHLVRLGPATGTRAA